MARSCAIVSGRGRRVYDHFAVVYAGRRHRGVTKNLFSTLFRSCASGHDARRLVVNGEIAAAGGLGLGTPKTAPDLFFLEAGVRVRYQLSNGHALHRAARRSLPHNHLDSLTACCAQHNYRRSASRLASVAFVEQRRGRLGWLTLAGYVFSVPAAGAPFASACERGPCCESLAGLTVYCTVARRTSSAEATSVEGAPWAFLRPPREPAGSSETPKPTSATRTAACAPPADAPTSNDVGWTWRSSCGVIGVKREFRPCAFGCCAHYLSGRAHFRRLPTTTALLWRAHQLLFGSAAGAVPTGVDRAASACALAEWRARARRRVRSRRTRRRGGNYHSYSTG